MNSHQMPRNRQGFSEFQVGLLRALADELEGKVVASATPLDYTPLFMVMDRQFCPVVRWVYGEEPAFWTGNEYVPMASSGMTLNGFIKAVRDLKEDDNG